MSPRVQTQVLAGLLILSLLMNGWMLLENRTLLSEQHPQATFPSEVVVHVVGAVVSPGVYQLSDTARVSDAIAAAGGSLSEAELSNLNLARRLYDGEQIMVPRQLLAVVEQGSSGEPLSSAHAQTSSLININTASQSQLETLPGIGPVKAAAIISYRQQHGPFMRIEDIMKVSGIGDKTFAGLRDLIIAR